MTYELWHFETRNLIASDEDLNEILDIVLDYLKEDGPEFIDRLGFAAVDNAGNTVEKLTGAALITRALERIPA